MRKNNEVEWRHKYLAALVKQGQLWRARESLQGRIRAELFDPGLYEDYGRILLLMGDLPEAGKYLFLCGERRPEYEEAIQLFISRHDKQGWFSLIKAFPKRARNVSLQSFPQSVQLELSQLEYPPERGEIVPPKAPERSKVPDFLCLVGCALLAFFILLIFTVGFAELVRLLFTDTRRP